MDLFYVAGSALVGALVGGPLGIAAGVLLFYLMRGPMQEERDTGS